MFKRKGRKVVSVYGIVGTDGLLVYIGVTAKSLRHRMAGHRKSPVNIKMAAWLAVNPSAQIHLLCRVTAWEWEACERFMIAYGRKRGRLLNQHPGGQIHTETLPGEAGPSVRVRVKAEPLLTTASKPKKKPKPWRGGIKGLWERTAAPLSSWCLATKPAPTDPPSPRRRIIA